MPGILLGRKSAKTFVIFIHHFDLLSFSKPCWCQHCNFYLENNYLITFSLYIYTKHHFFNSLPLSVHYHLLRPTFCIFFIYPILSFNQGPISNQKVISSSQNTSQINCLIYLPYSNENDFMSAATLLQLTLKFTLTKTVEEVVSVSPQAQVVLSSLFRLY